MTEPPIWAANSRGVEGGEGGGQERSKMEVCVCVHASICVCFIICVCVLRAIDVQGEAEQRGCKERVKDRWMRGRNMRDG